MTAGLIRYWLGIDPGKKGGLALINEVGQIESMEVMPEDDRLVVDSLIKFSAYAPHVIIEHAHAMPGQGVTSMFNYGYGFGVLVGAVLAARLKLTLVRPKQWQKEVISVGSKADPKTLARAAAQMLWPRETFLSTPRCKKPHEGLIDAALIAEAGRRKFK